MLFSCRVLILIALTAWCLTVSWVSPSDAIAAPVIGKRVALVVGNGAYKVAPALENPSVDAKAISAALKRLGFDVIEGYDLDLAMMKVKVAEFAEALPDAKAAVLYYAGHGVSVDEENYLLPTDVVLRSPSDLDLNAIGLSVVLKMMKRQETVNVVILDACRDNPFASEFANSSKKTRAVVSSRGLSAIDNELAKGTLIAFATDPKSAALDGRAGENSPFTKALAAHIEDPGVPIGTVMDRVRADVFEATRSKQTPWVNTSIIGEFFLNPTTSTTTVASLGPQTLAPVTLPNVDRQAQENILWNSAEKSNVPEDYRVYLDAYPNGVYAQMAKNRIARLGGAVAAATPGGGGVSPPPGLPTTPPPALAAPPLTPKIDPAVLRTEIGTSQTEKALALDKAGRVEVQMRLRAIEFDPKETNGAFGPKSRAAIVDWQKQHEIATTSWLGPVQLAALKQESEVQYQRLLAAAPMTPAGVSAAPTRVRSIRPEIRQARTQRVRTARQSRQPRQSSSNGFSQAAGFIGGLVTGAVIGHALRR